MGIAGYTDPVTQLLTHDYQHSHLKEKWPDLVTKFGLASDHIPELIRLAMDLDLESLPETEWEGVDSAAPLSAMQALGQLHAEAAIAPLITLFDTDYDLVREIIPPVFSLIGPGAIAPLAEPLANEEFDIWGRILAINCLEAIGKEHPDSRPDCVELLTAQLRKYATNDITLDSSLVNALVQLKATEADKLIEQVFTQKELDEWVTGSWANAQVQLGLKQESDFTPEELAPTPPPYILELRKNLNRFMQTYESAPKPKPEGFGAAKKTKKSSKKKKKK